MHLPFYNAEKSGGSNLNPTNTANHGVVNNNNNNNQNGAHVNMGFDAETETVSIKEQKVSIMPSVHKYSWVGAVEH